MTAPQKKLRKSILKLCQLRRDWTNSNFPSELWPFEILAVFGVLPMVPLVILPMVPLVANGTIGLPMVPLGEPMVPLALPLVPMVKPMVPSVEP